MKKTEKTWVGEDLGVQKKQNEYLFCFFILCFVIVSQLSSPTCCVHNFFQLTIVCFNTLWRYIALIVTMSMNILCSSFWRVSLVSWKQRTEFPLFPLSFYAYVPPGRHQHQLAEIKILSVLFWNKKKLVISKSLKSLLFLRKLSVSITDANNGFDMHSLRIKENRDQARIGTNSTQMVNWFLKNLQQFLDFIHNCFNVFI